MADRVNVYIGAFRNIANLNEQNFAKLLTAIADTGPQSVFGTGGEGQPVNVTHPKPNAADPVTACFYRANFDPSEITKDSFKQALADLFGVDVGNVGDTFVDVSYSGGGRQTREWAFSYLGVDRVVFARYGHDGTTQDSKKEMQALIDIDGAAWGETVV